MMTYSELGRRVVCLGRRIDRRAAVSTNAVGIKSQDLISRRRVNHEHTRETIHAPGGCGFGLGPGPDGGRPGPGRAAGQVCPAPSTLKGWTGYAEPIKDWQDPAHRNPQYPWRPKGPFPFKPSWPRKDVPYTAEELGYFGGYLGSTGKTYDHGSYTPVANRRGLIISKNVFTRRTHYWDNFDQVMNYEPPVGVGSVTMKVFTILDSPPELRGMAQLIVRYNITPARYKPPDRFTYIPSLRRVRRSLGGDREDEVLGYPITNDDAGGRYSWEYTREIVAKDVLCKAGSQRGHSILGDPQSIVDTPVMPGVPGDGENPYREDGCLELWVVKTTPKDPNYYLSYMLTWFEKRTKISLRSEQYDRDGNLWKVFENCRRLVVGPDKRPVWTGNVNYMVDYKRDFWFMGWTFGWLVGVEIPESQYTIAQLEAERFWRRPKGYRQVVRFDQMPPYPPVYPEKISQYRRGANQFFDPRIKKKIQAHREMWERRGGYDAWGWALRTRFKDVP